MTAKLIDGISLAEEEFNVLRARVKALSYPPTLMIIADASTVESQFIRAKRRAGERIGVSVRVTSFHDDISATQLSDVVNAHARESALDGVVVQLPLPKHLDENRHGILRIIPDDRDVDCLSERWLGRFASGRTYVQLRNKRVEMFPPVVGAIKVILEAEHIEISGKRIVVVGWGDLVGKPSALWLLSKGATVTVVTAQERDLGEMTRTADIIVLGAGQPGVLRGDMVGKGVVVLDAGTSDDGGTLKGDAADDVLEHASAMTPVPGGIGPLTVAMLYRNLVGLAEARQT